MKTQKNYYIVYEYCKSGTLEEMIKKHQFINEKEVSVSYAGHRHSDLNPARFQDLAREEHPAQRPQARQRALQRPNRQGGGLRILQRPVGGRRTGSDHGGQPDLHGSGGAQGVSFTFIITQLIILEKTTARRRTFGPSASVFLRCFSASVLTMIERSSFCLRRSKSAPSKSRITSRKSP